jgi:hypothetical protein
MATSSAAFSLAPGRYKPTCILQVSLPQKWLSWRVFPHLQNLWSYKNWTHF